MEIAKREEKRMTAFNPYFFRSSCSGSEAHDRKVTTSFAIWLVVAGVPDSMGCVSQFPNTSEIMDGVYHRGIQLGRQRGHEP